MAKPHKVEEKLKPWGKEIWFAYTDKYAGKVLHVKKGHRYSLQYHEKKQETQYIYKGKVKFTYGQSEKSLKTIILKAGDKIDVKPRTIHRLEALENSEIFEVSTPDLKDVVKLSDDYGRTGKGNNEKLDKSLHKKLTK
ncbi:MAG: cupin [Candidatus Gracilibacteria bacterium]|jgi:mannose-6-phosphate isomerase-like protein (cupin superfamily)